MGGGSPGAALMIETAPYLMFEPQEELWWRVWVPLVYMLFTLLVYIPVLVAAGLEALLEQSLEAVSSRKICLKVEGERQFSWPGCFRNYLKQSQDGFGMWRTTFGHVLPLQKLELNCSKVGTELLDGARNDDYDYL